MENCSAMALTQQRRHPQTSVHYPDPCSDPHSERPLHTTITVPRLAPHGDLSPPSTQSISTWGRALRTTSTTMPQQPPLSLSTVTSQQQPSPVPTYPTWGRALRTTSTTMPAMP